MAIHTLRTDEMIVGETRTFSISFRKMLDSGELLTGVPTVIEQVTSDLTITNKAVSTAALTIDRVSNAIGEAVQYKVSDQVVSGSVYTVKITVATDGGQTFVRCVETPVVACTD